MVINSYKDWVLSMIKIYNNDEYLDVSKVGSCFEVMRADGVKPWHT